MLERDVSPPSLLAGALRCQFKVLILLCLGSPSSPRSWRMDLAVLREDLNLSWGWQRPGDKSLCAWGDQTPLSQHLFGWHRDLCCELLATVVLHSVEGVWNFLVFTSMDTAQEEPPRWEEGSESCQDSSSLQLKQGQNTGHEGTWWVYWGQLWEQHFEFKHPNCPHSLLWAVDPVDP